MTEFDHKIVEYDTIGLVDCKQSKIFDNVFIDKATNTMYILDDNHDITHKIIIPS